MLAWLSSRSFVMRVQRLQQICDKGDALPLLLTSGHSLPHLKTDWNVSWAVLFQNFVRLKLTLLGLAVPLSPFTGVGNWTPSSQQGANSFQSASLGSRRSRETPRPHEYSRMLLNLTVGCLLYRFNHSPPTNHRPRLPYPLKVLTDTYSPFA